MTVRILQGDVRARLAGLPAESVQCVVTSPPYLNLRSYLPDDHPDKAKEIGLHPHQDDYVEALVDVFREVRRVLRHDGVCFINLGDSYSGSGRGPTGGNGIGNQGIRQGFQNGARVRSDVAYQLDRLVKGQPVLVSNAVSVRVTAHRSNVPKQHQSAPQSVLFSLLGIERVTIKQRDQDFCQVLNTLGSPGYCRIDAPTVSVSVNESDAEVVLDTQDGVRIVISDLDTERESVLAVLRTAGCGPSEHSEAAFTIEEPGEPRTKFLRRGESVGDSIAFDTPLERFPDIHLVQQAIPLTDGLATSAGERRHFRVTQATDEKVVLGLISGVEIEVRSVRHLYAPNAFGSLVSYSELYDKATKKANASVPKQLLGIPDMVKRALMEDGWICRSSIAWCKKSAMPESVTDRPTSAWEHIWMFTKSARYFWDAAAVRQPSVAGHGSGQKLRKVNQQPSHRSAFGTAVPWEDDGQGANLRNYWLLGPEPSREEHYAAFPSEIPRRCILAASRPGDTVLDPFLGSGTTALVADQLERNAIGCELNPKYAEMARRRITNDCPMFTDVEVAV